MNEQALKDRLRAIAQTWGKTFNEVWKLLLLERFLARLSLSRFRDSFVFKGGLLLAQHLKLARETTDVDLLRTRMDGSPAARFACGPPNKFSPSMSRSKSCLSAFAALIPKSSRTTDRWDDVVEVGNDTPGDIDDDF